MTDRDDALLARLAAAMRPAVSEPTLAELTALERAVATASAGPTRRIARKWLAAGAAALLVSGTGTAFALSGSPLPKPVRAVAHAVGLPVDSEDLAHARSALADLRVALAGSDRDTIEGAADRLREALDALNARDRAVVADEAQRLLREAEEVLGSSEEDAESGHGGNSGNGSDDSPDSSGSGSDGGADSSDGSHDSDDEPDSPDEPDSSGSGSGEPSDSGSSDDGSSDRLDSGDSHESGGPGSGDLTTTSTTDSDRSGSSSIADQTADD